MLKSQQEKEESKTHEGAHQPLQKSDEAMPGSPSQDEESPEKATPSMQSKPHEGNLETHESTARNIRSDQRTDQAEQWLRSTFANQQPKFSMAKSNNVMGKRTYAPYTGRDHEQRKSPGLDSSRSQSKSSSSESENQIAEKPRRSSEHSDDNEWVEPDDDDESDDQLQKDYANQFYDFEQIDHYFALPKSLSRPNQDVDQEPVEGTDQPVFQTPGSYKRNQRDAKAAHHGSSSKSKQTFKGVPGYKRRRVSFGDDHRNQNDSSDD